MKVSGGLQPRKEEGALYFARRNRNAEAFLTESTYSLLKNLRLVIIRPETRLRD